jgi:hypothetical protein
MKNKLWAFGDSYTAGVLPDIDHFTPYIEYLKYLGISKEEFPLGWSYQLANKLNLDPSVVAVGGASNEEISINLYQSIPHFKKNDIVIVQWSYMNRFLWASSPKNYNLKNIQGNPFGKFKRASIHTECNVDYDFVSDKVFKQIGVNKSLEPWLIQIHSFENLLEYFSNIIGFKIYFWSTDDLIHLSLKNKLINNPQYILGNIIFNYRKKIKRTPREFLSNYFLEAIRQLGATSIYQESNKTIDDKYHLGIKGNEVLTDLFYQHINLDNSK